MTLKYSDKPQLRYGNQTASDNWRSRFPADAMPISQAPAQVVVAYEAEAKDISRIIAAVHIES
jgi:hypothetical protein